VWTFRIRWRAILQPWCAIFGHRPVVIHGFGLNPSSYRCSRCYLVRPGGRMIQDDDTTLWWESMNFDGSVIGRYWRGGPVESSSLKQSERPRYSNTVSEAAREAFRWPQPEGDPDEG